MNLKRQILWSKYQHDRALLNRHLEALNKKFEQLSR